MRRGVVIASLALLSVLSWGLWPQADSRLAIRFDAAKTATVVDFLAHPVASVVENPPNVVLIVADDLGKHDISVYGPSATPTPRLAALAAEGATFTAGYVTSPVCSPSRAALLTGRYPQRYGFELLVHDRYPRNRLEWWFARQFFSTHGWSALDQLRVPKASDLQRQGLPPSEITLAELLKKQGYATAVIGKWHLGTGDNALPLKRGFDHHYGFYDAFSLYADADDPSIVGARGEYFADRYQWWRGRSGGSAIRRDNAVIDEDGYLTARIADETIDWIAAHRDQPFFAYVPFSAPHAPMQAPREYVDRFVHVASPDQRVYYAMIAALDDAIGEIMAALARFGVADNTIVVFVSDNGAASYTGVVDNAPLKGGKLTNFEGGINVPFLFRWPRQIAAGTKYASPVSTLDVFITITRAAGVELPVDRKYDGVDLLPHVTGAVTADPHDALYWRAQGHRAIRAGRYKLISDTATGGRALYDLDADPSEQHDLSSERPALAEELERTLRAWEAELAPPAWPNVMEYRFSDGTSEFIFPL
jgi:arylsulfatase A-like enzyme